MSAPVPGGYAQGWPRLPCLAHPPVGTADIADRWQALKSFAEPFPAALRRGEAPRASTKRDALRATQRKATRARCDPTFEARHGVPRAAGRGRLYVLGFFLR